MYTCFAIDAHIHLDRIDPGHRQQFMSRLAEDRLERVIAIAVDEGSCRALLRLKSDYPQQVEIAFGYHPEHPWDEQQAEHVRQLILLHRSELVAIGEVGLPYYSLSEIQRKKGVDPLYLARVEPFVALARELDLPLVLHAVHESTVVMLDLLQQYSIQKAHFHWLKAPIPVIKRLVECGYYVSVTPEVCYRPRDQELVLHVPRHLLLVETDAPWQYQGSFQNQPTEPKMVWNAIRTIAELWREEEAIAAQQIWENTKRCYNL